MSHAGPGGSCAQAAEIANIAMQSSQSTVVNPSNGSLPVHPLLSFGLYKSENQNYSIPKKARLVSNALGKTSHDSLLLPKMHRAFKSNVLQGCLGAQCTLRMDLQRAQ
eukprot:262354-Pelagomonas_calceolata.AAC.1